MAYNVAKPYNLVVNGNMASTITSAAFQCQEQDNVGIQLNWTGTPTGAFTFQVSMDYFQDYNGNITNAGNWITLTLNPAITASGSANIAYVDFNQLSAPYIRFVYTPSAGSGTLNAFVTAKGV